LKKNYVLDNTWLKLKSAAELASLATTPYHTIHTSSSKKNMTMAAHIALSNVLSVM
jgi:hypothetical protein